MPHSLNWFATASLALAGIFLMGSSLAEVDAGSPQPVSPPPAIPDEPSSKSQRKWQPDPEQTAALAMLPKDREAQRQELIRLSRIPLPSYEERGKLDYLMGGIFPNWHPLRENEAFLVDHYRSQGQPTKSELDALVTSLKKRLIHLKGGSFMMGDFGPLVFKDKLTLTGNRNSGPAHEVHLDGYSIMKGRVTYGEYDLYLRAYGKDLLPEGEIIHSRRPGYVATGVNWTDADGYCKWLGAITGKPFALPTEAQWEYAAREGGKLIAYPMYHLPGVKWQNKYQPVFSTSNAALQRVKDQAGKENAGMTPYPPSLNGENRIGMQGVLGGGWESMADWYQEDYYSVSPKRNPRGPEHGTERVVREGSYSLFNTILGRHGVPPERGQEFRCVLNEVKPWK